MKRAALPLILVCAYLLRVYLVWAGGQDFWPDEMRYNASKNAVHGAFHGEWSLIARELMGHPDHVLFRTVGLPAALAEHVFGPDPALVGAYFAIFSTLAIFLIWAVCRRAGGSVVEANWAALFAACANSLFFYSRHYLPYDASLCAMLAGLWWAVGPPSKRSSFRAGLAVGVGFLIYNGYWLLGGAILVSHTVLGDGGWRRAYVRAAWAAAGLLTPVLLWLGAGESLGFELVSDVRSFAGSVIRGDFGLGYVVVGAYLWEAETGLLVLWLLAALYATYDALQRRHMPRRLRWWLALLLVMLAGLIGLSDVIEKFVVYGRLVRALVPLLCLAAAIGLVTWLERRRKVSAFRLSIGIGGLAVTIAFVNLSVPLSQQFIGDFRARVAGHFQKQKLMPGAEYGLVAVQEFWEEIPDPELPPHDVVLRSRHPLQFRPYQYESHTRAERAKLRKRDVSMRLIRFADATARIPALDLDGYPGPVGLRVRFPAAPPGQAQPLITSGLPRRGDLFYVRMLDGDRVTFGLDKWTGHGFESEPISIEAGRTYELTVSLGSLFPPPESSLFREKPELSRLRSQAVVLLDGEVVYSAPREFHPSAPSNLWFGTNVIGGSVVSADFRGVIEEIRAASLAEISAFLPSLALGAIAQAREPEWRGNPGPVRLNLVLPPEIEGVPQPLLAMGNAGDGALLFVVRTRDGLQFGYHQLGEAIVMSQQLLADLGAPQVIEVLGWPLMPPLDAAIYDTRPSLKRTENLIYVRLNGAPAFRVTDIKQAAAQTVTLGANTVGSGAAVAYFSGVLTGSGAAEVERLSGRDHAFLTMPVLLDPRWDGYCGPLRLRVVLPEDSIGRSEPLLVTGTPGAANFFFVRYEDDRHVRLGFDHWGLGGPLSEPIPIEPGDVHEIVVHFGSLLPPPGHPVDQLVREVAPLRSWLYVEMNGQVIINQSHPAHVSEAETITIGVNRVGGSSCQPDFRGRVELADRVLPADILARTTMEISASEPDFVSLSRSRPGWQEYPGPVRLSVIFPAAEGRQTDIGEPLITTGREGLGDFLFVQHQPDGLSRVGYDHWGAPVRWSEPFRLEGGQEHRFTVSLGSLYPPPSSPLYEEQPALRNRLARLVVSLDGRRIMDTAVNTHATAAQDIRIGLNPIGGSTTRARLGAQLVSLELEEAEPAGLSAP